ncbi:uncharacterized protein LOC135641677 [Musa acuminata AAA Group]|uniref:uncharacterized protein LOC135641677 n=1 Tax=Musa acuminata AAA Group TaxID=214697 RepID=UPI0031DCC2BF
MFSPKKRKRRVTRRRQRRRRRDHGVTAHSRPEERGVDFFSPSVAKYWRQRYSLFSRFDDGILMDEEGWYSVTPEAIAAAHAARATSLAGRGCPLVLDGFAGVGGNAIQFASRGCHVVAVDIDPRKIGFAVHNAKIYGVEDRIDFVTGDFFRLAPRLKGDILFLSPPWGGPSYRDFRSYTLDLLMPRDGYSIFQLAQQITPNIILFLPRNVNLNQVEELSWLSSPPLKFEIEANHVQTKVKAITAYFGDIAAGSSGLSKICSGVTS